jgi:hypothetical protein
MNVRKFAILVLPLVLLTSACSGTSPVASGPAGSPEESASARSATTRSNDGGDVTVVADWADPADGAVFEVTLDTHSIDLDGLDLADAVLRNDRDETLSARPWAAPKGGHHRTGALSFGGDFDEFFAGARWVELVLAGVGDIPERTLRWEVGS